jgi:hypothetical protein
MHTPHTPTSGIEKWGRGRRGEGKRQEKKNKVDRRRG